MDNETLELIEVSKGNPGAITVINSLMYFSRWGIYLKYFKDNNIVGEQIWILYKDIHHCDIEALAKYLDAH